MEITFLNTITTTKTIVKKSIFYGFAYPINSEEDVKQILKKIKTKHKQANHVAYAYKISVIVKNNKILSQERYDDAGEPSKTAGFPLLHILQQKKVTNTLLVVARVFGGIKLGTAGLIKAYRDAGLSALEAGELITKPLCKQIKLSVELRLYSRLETQLKQHKYEYTTTFESENVIVNLLLPLGDEHKLDQIEFNLYKE